MTAIVDLQRVIRATMRDTRGLPRAMFTSFDGRAKSTKTPKKRRENPLGWAEADANRRVVLTCVPPCLEPQLVETTDPFDRAHAQRSGDGTLLPAARRIRSRVVKLPRCVPRKYHPTQLVRVGAPDCVAWDSAYDSLYEAQRRLDGVEGIGVSADLDHGGTSSVSAQAIAAIRIYGSGPELRSRLRPRTRLSG